MAVRPRAQASKKGRARRAQPVCVVLKDGSYYVGFIGGMRGGELTLSGVRGTEKWNPRAAKRSWQKAKISALAEAAEANAATQTAAAGEAAGGASPGGGLGGLGGLEDLMGFMQKALPFMKMSMDMIKTIMPLMGSLKF